MPESYPGIQFNDEGICNYCLNYKQRDKYLGKDRLVQLMSSAENRGKYDCVVPLSGGKDSTYVLYYAVKELGLNAIAVNYDSGFQSELAIKNMKLACEALDVRLIIKRAKDDIQKKVVKESLLISEIVGSFVLICANCENMLRVSSLNVAKKYGVPFVLWGSTSGESIDYEWYRQSRYGINLLSVISQIVRGLIRVKLTPKKAAKITPRVIKFLVLSIYLRILMDVPLRYAFFPLLRTMPFTKNDPQVVHFFDYVYYEPAEQMRLLRSALKWEHPKNKDIRFDCLLHCFENHRSLQLNQISYDGIVYCNLIRQNLIDRKDGLAKEEYVKDLDNQECKRIIDELGLTKFRTPTMQDNVS